MDNKEMDWSFITARDDGDKILARIVRQAKKNIILQDEDDFIEENAPDLVTDYGFSNEDATKFLTNVFLIWEDECGCSVTSFDQTMKALRKTLFP
jgi:hypothetical protein